MKLLKTEEPVELLAIHKGMLLQEVHVFTSTFVVVFATWENLRPKSTFCFELSLLFPEFSGSLSVLGKVAFHAPLPCFRMAFPYQYVEWAPEPDEPSYPCDSLIHVHGCLCNYLPLLPLSRKFGCDNCDAWVIRRRCPTALHNWIVSFLETVSIEVELLAESLHGVPNLGGEVSQQWGHAGIEIGPERYELRVFSTSDNALRGRVPWGDISSQRYAGVVSIIIADLLSVKLQPVTLDHDLQHEVLSQTSLLYFPVFIFLRMDYQMKNISIRSRASSIVPLVTVTKLFWGVKRLFLVDFKGHV